LDRGIETHMAGEPVEQAPYRSRQPSEENTFIV
jgi:hypothetical protein